MTGADTVPEATIIQVAEAPIGTPLAKVDLNAIAERVRSIQSVADAQVTRAWPNQLEIVVTERVPVVVVTDGKQFELVDATGVRPSRPCRPRRTGCPRRSWSVPGGTSRSVRW